MSTQLHAMPESFQAQNVAPAAIPATRAFYWSVRRELWENRSIYIAPLAVATVALFAFSLGLIAGIWDKALRLDPAQPRQAVAIAVRHCGGSDDAHGHFSQCVLLS
jgi:ABC-2 type transport system permease protein